MSVRRAGSRLGAVRLDVAVLDSLPDKMIILGALEHFTRGLEMPDAVAAHSPRVPARRPGAADRHMDCGMKCLSRAAAYGKLVWLIAGARLATAA